MGKHYEHLKPEERATVMLMRREGMSVRAVAGTLNRSPSSISRELSRHSVEGTLYDASIAGAYFSERDRSFRGIVTDAGGLHGER